LHLQCSHSFSTTTFGHFIVIFTAAFGCSVVLLDQIMVSNLHCYKIGLTLSVIDDSFSHDWNEFAGLHQPSFPSHTHKHCQDLHLSLQKTCHLLSLHPPLLSIEIIPLFLLSASIPSVLTGFIPSWGGTKASLKCVSPSSLMNQFRKMKLFHMARRDNKQHTLQGNFEHDGSLI